MPLGGQFSVGGNSVHPALKDPQAYWPLERWGVAHLSGDRLAALRRVFDEEFWSTVPALEGGCAGLP
ncbi:hypothetical protein [Rhodoferax ferrireducens]|uniref:hypothetical protein n=1 Tax=Rhodoferax ferrireducens TaxID=192843 RepID=UPI00140FD6FF|nr:hypothetical protein [Rhodoferax ferrireducens]